MDLKNYGRDCVGDGLSSRTSLRIHVANGTLQVTVILHMKSLTTATAKPLSDRLVNELGSTYASRLRSLLPLFKDGAAVYAEALSIIAPHKDQQAAQKDLVAFVGRVNRTAKEHGIQMQIKLDSQKQSNPMDRRMWIIGEDFTQAGIDKITIAETDKLDRMELIEPKALIQNRSEMEGTAEQKQLVRVFVSFTRADEQVNDLLKRLKTHLKLSKKFRFEFWIDRDIQPNRVWRPEIQRAIKECHLGLLLVSPDYFASDFIMEHELPHFVSGQKPAVPVAMKQLNFKGEMGSLEERQVYFFEDEQRRKKPYSAMRGENGKSDFVMRLADVIEKEAESFAQANSIQSLSEQLDIQRQCDLDFSHLNISAMRALSKLKASVEPNARIARLDNKAIEASRQSANASSAVDYLSDWVMDGDASSFAAVLGEAGMGKTTMLMMLARRLNERRESDPTVMQPIFVDLRDYSEQKEATLEAILNDLIRRYATNADGPTITVYDILNAVRTKKAVIIFDGLDEKIIPLSQAQRVAFINELWRVLPVHKRDRSGCKMIISCRSHYFPTITAQNSALTGQGREGMKEDDFTACIMVPFSEEQIRQYLSQVVGLDRVESTLQLFASVHNLLELAERPMLLSFIVDQIEELERKKSRGESVQGVTLYELFVQKWIARDDGKHLFTPRHKLLMMEELAYDFWKSNSREWKWEVVDDWLDKFLARHPEIRARYQSMLPETLNQDFRTATFYLRPDDSSDEFRFAHTSLQEYFLALALVHGLESNKADVWDLPTLSNETLDFIGQLLLIADPSIKRTCTTALTALLDSVDASADARMSAFRYWLCAYEKGYPNIYPQQANLSGLDLSRFEIAGRNERSLFPLRGARIDGTRMYEARLKFVDLSGAQAESFKANWAEFQYVRADGINLKDADLTATLWRHSSLRNAKIEQSQWLGASLLFTDSAGTDWSPDQVQQANFCSQESNVKPITNSELNPRIVYSIGHPSLVRSVSYSGDGRRLASVGDDHRVCIWDAVTGELLHTLAGHEGSVTSVSYSGDGRRLVSVGDDHRVCVWDAVTGELLHTLAGHEGPVNSVSFSGDGRRLASGGDDHRVRIWDAVTGELLHTLAGHKESVRSVSYSGDGSRLASGGYYDNRVCIWDAVTGELLHALVGHENSIMSVSYSGDGGRLASVGDDHRVCIWDASNGEFLHALLGHENGIRSVSFSGDGRRLASAGYYDNRVCIWDAVTGELLHTLAGHVGSVASLSYSGDGSRLASSGDDNRVCIWDAVTGELLHTLAGHEGSVMSVSYSGDGSRLASGSDNRVCIWDAITGELLHTLASHKGSVNSVSFSGDGRRLASGGDDNRVCIWDAVTGELLHALVGHEDSVMSVSYSGDGSRLASGGFDKRVCIWDGGTGELLHKLAGHKGSVMSVSYSGDGVRLASGGNDNRVCFWDAVTGKLLQLLAGHKSSVRSVSYSGDGRRLVSGGDDNQVRIWDAVTGKCLHTLVGHADSVRSVSYSGDDSRLASGGDDNRVCIWDAVTGELLHTLVGHQDWARNVSYSADGRRLASGGDDNRLCVWDAETGVLLRTTMLGDDGQFATVDIVNNRPLQVSEEGWRLFRWRSVDLETGEIRILPAEYFGPLPH